MSLGETPLRRVTHKLLVAGDLGTTIELSLPKDHFLNQVMIEFIAGTLSGGSSPAWVTGAMDLINNGLRFICNGNKYFKKFTDYAQMKQIGYINKDKQPVGYHKLLFIDPRIPEAKALPSWVFTSVNLEIDLLALASLTTGSPTGIGNTFCNVYLSESNFAGEDISNFRVLVEKVAKTESYGANTGEQEYEHERAYKVFGYLYDMDDNGTRSDTKFDVFDLEARTKEKQIILKDKMSIAGLKAMNNAMFQQALDTGFAYLDFAPKGLDTSVYTSLKTKPNIPTAGTNIKLKTVERYIL